MSPDKIYLIVFGVFALVIGYDVFNWWRYRSFSKPEIRRRRLISAVNFSVALIGIIVLVVSVAFHVNIFDYSRPIRYSDIKTITLKDFKGFKIPGATLHGENKFAFITTSIEWEEIENGIEIECMFHPSRSYVFNENVDDKFLLEHELYHFHIAEYFSRQCRKGIAGMEKVPSDDAISAVIAWEEQMEDEMQEKYDDETYHGYIRKEQKRWMEKVDSLLNSDLEFQNSIISFN